MPVLSPCEDVKSLIERHAGIKTADKGATVHGVREYHSNCPWCGGTDRFITRPETGWYTCSTRSSGCGKRGDMIDFLMDYASMSMREACEEIGLDPDEVEFCREEDRVTYAQSLLMPPCKEWQSHAKDLIHIAKKCLWSSRGVDVLNYLRARGFTDETILHADLGYIPAGADGLWQKEGLEVWGLSSEDVKSEQVTLYAGVLIPWYADGQIWKLEVRRIGNLKETDNKIPTIVGSRDTLYNLDAIQPGQPVVQVESALDALSGTQACGDRVPFVATGGVDKAKHERWVKQFEQSSCVINAFDDDAPGDKGAVFWENALPNVTRWLPDAHDINDMLVTGMDIKTWVTQGIEYHNVKEKAKKIPMSTVSPAGDPPITIVQDVPSVEPGQVDDPIHPAIRAAMRLCQQGIIFRLEDDCLVVYYRPAVAEEVERLYEHRGVLTDWVRSIRQKETGYAEATAFYEQFCAQPGYGLRLREDNKVGVTVPESVSDADFERIVDAVCAQGDELKQVLKQRAEKDRKQEPAATCCKCASPVEYYSPGGHAYCTACYRCAGCNQVPRWVYNPERDLQVCACVMEASQRVTRYTPYTLSAFSRTNCPHHVITLKDNRFRSTSCKGKTLEHGWCADHAYAHELLCLGASLGYPAVHGDYRHIEQRVENWEVYAACTSAQHAAGDVARIRTRYRYHAPLDLSVPVVQKTTQPPQWAQSSVYTSVLATRSKVDPTTSMDALV